MVREEAKNIFDYLYEGTFHKKVFMSLVDKIFNEHEAQLNTKDERIKELEEAIKPKTCDGCVHEVEDMQDLYCAFCSRSCDDNFEPKDNA